MKEGLIDREKGTLKIVTITPLGIPFTQCQFIFENEYYFCYD